MVNDLITPGSLWHAKSPVSAFQEIRIVAKADDRDAWLVESTSDARHLRMTAHGILSQYYSATTGS